MDLAQFVTGQTPIQWPLIDFSTSFNPHTDSYNILLIKQLNEKIRN